MARIRNEILSLEISKIFKNNETGPVITDEQLQTLAEVVEATVAELINDPSLVVEVSRLNTDD